ncbi:hypothetical protein LTR94_032091, partial [Friedmanniomyces endolithicus]
RGGGRRRGGDLPLRRLDAVRRQSQPNRAGRRAGQSDRRRIRPAAGAGVASAARGDARPVARLDARQGGDALRSRGRRPAQPPPPQDRRRSARAGDDPHDPRRRLYVRDAGGAML